jgi:hypothetical protein
MLRICATAIALGLLASVAWRVALADEEQEPEAPQHTIKEVMKLAHKDGLLKKVLDGKGRHKDAMELIDLYASLADNQPPKGDAESWKAKTDALIIAAARFSVRRKDGIAKLKVASDCKACHTAHKGE